MPYVTTYRWEGALQDDAYSREGTTFADSAPAIPVGVGGSVPGGSEARWNPETLLGAALCDCYMLTFLSIARKARLDVRVLDARAELTLVTDALKQTKVERIDLHVIARVGPDTDAEKVRVVYAKSHKYCIIANSLAAPVVPTIEVVGP